jgi:NSS family neurotransmitter:Na+ symporter
VVSGIVVILGIPSALSQGSVESLSSMNIFGQTGFLSLMSFVFSDLSLPIGGLFICIFVAWVWGASNAFEEIKIGAGTQTISLLSLWRFLIKYVCPVIIAVVLLNVFGVF